MKEADALWKRSDGHLERNDTWDRCHFLQVHGDYFWLDLSSIVLFLKLFG